MRRSMFFLAVVGVLMGLMWPVAAQVEIDPAAWGNDDFKEAWWTFLSTKEGMRIGLSVYLLSLSHGTPVEIKWLPNNELDPPAPKSGAFGNCRWWYNTNTNALARPMVIKIRSVRTGGLYNLADTIHHELRHAEFVLMHGPTAMAPHQSLDNGTDPANNLFQLQLLLNGVKGWCRSLWGVVKSAGESVGEMISTVVSSFEPGLDLPFDASTGAGIPSLIHEPLFTVGEDLMVYSNLVLDREVSEDGRRLVAYLRRDCLFHNGAELTAEDVVRTYNWLLHSEEELSLPLEVVWLFDVEPLLQEVNPIDSYTVEFVFSSEVQPEWWYDRGTRSGEASYGGPNPLWILAHVPILGPELDRTVGLGPYRFSEYMADQHVMLESFSDYRLGAEDAQPRPRQVLFRITPNPAVTVAMLETREIDFIFLPPAAFFEPLDSKLSADLLSGAQARLVVGDGQGNEEERLSNLLVLGPRLEGVLEGSPLLLNLGGDGYTSKTGDYSGYPEDQ